MKVIINFLFIATLTACANGETIKEEKPEGVAIDNSMDMSYWYQGEAELTSYDLKQSRYGELHEGHAVLIFVTEPFNIEKQVKADRPETVPSTNVLKLNFTKKFVTGIYPYSMMTSVFTPIDRSAYPKTLKVTNSNQDWCGQTFMQLNLKKEKYHVKQFSYFESEGDFEKEIEDVFLEDAVWNLIRLSPGELPIGEINIYPSTSYLRLRHRENRVYSAVAEMEEFDEHMTYTLKYEDRILSIDFEKASPFKITGWTEKYLLDDGSSPESLSTTAEIRKRIKIDYWNKNSVADSTWRSKLGLE